MSSNRSDAKCFLISAAFSSSRAGGGGVETAYPLWVGRVAHLEYYDTLNTVGDEGVVSLKGDSVSLSLGFLRGTATI